MSARTDLCGGRSAMIVSTATSSTMECEPHGRIVAYSDTCRLPCPPRQTKSSFLHAYPLLTLTFLSSVNRKTSTLWDVVGAHLSLQLCPNGSEAADDPRVERDAIHWIKPNSVPRDEGHYTFGSTCIVSRFDQFVCHLLPARRTLSNVAR
jgi:hypothetical protein